MQERISPERDLMTNPLHKTYQKVPPRSTTQVLGLSVIPALSEIQLQQSASLRHHCLAGECALELGESLEERASK
jgi:hypothetical protein